MRGLPHLHGVFWLNQEEAEKYQDGNGNFTDEKVPELIDKWISCSLTNYKDEKSDEKEENPDDQQEKIDERQENLEEEQENPKEKGKKLDEKLNNLVKEVNIHKHSKSCQKGSNPCRFSFPRLPSNRTLISNPISEEEFLDEAYNIVSNSLSEDESSRRIYNLIYNYVIHVNSYEIRY